MIESNTEWSAVEFLRQTVTRESGFTMTFIDAIEEITNQAEQAQEFENLYDEQLEESQETYSYFNEEIKKLREAIILSLENHKWNNEKSARILEQALEATNDGN